MPAVIPPTMDVHLTGSDLREAMERDVRSGLAGDPKSLPPVYFYDDRGSRLFDEITRLPEYYPTRAERSILDSHAGDIAERAGADTLVELGAGTCEKSRILLDAMQSAGTLQRFVPLDVSDTTLWHAATALAEEYPGVAVSAVVADFHHHLDRLPSDGTKLFAFLGGTIGNLDPGQRRTFFIQLAKAMTMDDRLLLGTDLVKDRGRLVSAYDDGAGVTAAFNRNVLLVLNRELGANFDPEQFEHVARFNEADQRIEMHLRSARTQQIRVADLDLDVTFLTGEEMLTEISTKFTPEALEAELNECGFVVESKWLSEGDEFLLTMARPSS
ncbi:MAG TPA: L-histidine N(alpha)-methyltransferase [Acidimicrobiales bacterium]|nr:L-histidine N(alpha)-methyltransferase [Acidimicrobiales bacterium]